MNNEKMTFFKQKYRQTLGIFVICFLLNDKSLAEDGPRAPFAVIAKTEPEGRALFNPRVDYNNQWMPVGHSDPLKNEPTFDYSPPTLERVRYWSEYNDNDNTNTNTNSNSNNNNNEKTSNTNNNNLNEKSEILLLGVPIKHTLYPHKNHPTNQLTQTEAKSSNRRSSTYYPPEPSRVLTPPPLQPDPLPFDQMAFASDYHQQSNYWKNELPQSIPDAYTDESASYLTVVKPKLTQSPFATTLYNKDVRNSIYHLAANVNSLETSDKKNAWVQSLLQKEITHQPQATTPQLIVAYSPKIFDSTPAKFSKITEKPELIRTEELAMPFTSTTPIPPKTTAATTTTAPPFSIFKPAILPTRPPLYLIIQGHSKVKTYGAEHGSSKNITTKAKMVPVTPKIDPIVNHVVSQDSSGNEIQVKHLHKLHIPTTRVKSTTPSSLKKLTNSPMESLLSLLDKSFGGFGFGGSSNNEKDTIPKSDAKKSNGEHVLKENPEKKSTIKSTITGPTTVRPFNETQTNANAFT